MRIAAAVMAVIFSLSSVAWAAGPEFTGSLRSTGVVLANAIVMPDGGTVRSGDTISTRPGALAVITAPSHGRLEIRPASEARLAGDRIRLEHGAVASSQMAVEVAGYIIRPESAAPAWFAVAKQDGRLLVAAHRGNVIIASAGRPPVVVEQGSLAQKQQEKDQRNPPEQTPAAKGSEQEQPAPEQNTQPKKSPRRRKGAAGAAVGGWTIGGLSHGASIAVVAGVTAAVAGTVAGVAVAASDSGGISGQGPSPSQ
jgi:hypothetical protein